MGARPHLWLGAALEREGGGMEGGTIGKGGGGGGGGREEGTEKALSRVEKSEHINNDNRHTIQQEEARPIPVSTEYRDIVFSFCCFLSFL